MSKMMGFQPLNERFDWSAREAAAAACRQKQIDLYNQRLKIYD